MSLKSACARNGARSSGAARKYKPLQELKIAYFLVYLQNIRTQEVDNYKKL